MRRAARVLAALAGIAGLTTPAGAGRRAEPAAVVRLTDELQFIPSTVKVKAGDIVRWQSVSLMVHTVTDDRAKAARPADAALPPEASPFDSGNIEPPGGAFEHAFTLPGTYKYFCMPHEGARMVGEVIVVP